MLAATAGASAQFDLPGSPQREQPSADRLVKVRVVPALKEIGPHDTMNLLVVFEIEPDWHIYWRNPGEGAAAPTFEIEAPERFHVGDVRWPRPKVIKSPVGDMYGYEGTVALFVPVTAPAPLHDGIAVFTTNVTFAVCDNRMCFFGRRSIRTTINTSKYPVDASREADDSFVERHRKRLPISVRDSDDATAELIGDGDTRQLVVRGPAHDFTQAEFLPYNSPGVSYQRPKFTFEDDRFTAVIDLKVNPVNFTQGPPMVGGLVGLGRRSDGPSYVVELPLGRRAPEPPPDAPSVPLTPPSVPGDRPPSPPIPPNVPSERPPRTP